MKGILTILASMLLCISASAFEPVVYKYDTAKQTAFSVNVPVPDGNYLVTMKIGSKKRAGETFVKYESRRLAVNDLRTAKGEFKTVSFVVNKRDRHIVENGKAVTDVITKIREVGKLDWDDFLNIEILGNAPVVESITVEAAPSAVTIFLCGDSTVVDQDIEPWASWGQMFPWFFDTSVAVANYGESGERADTFIGAGRLRKILTQMKEGDYVFVEFGHNDQKMKGPGYGGYYFFATQLKKFVDEVRAKGGIPVFVTPTMRRSFGPDGKNQATHEDYPDGMKWVASRENVPLIDLQTMSGLFYEALGEEGSKSAFVHYKAGSYEDMPRDVADNTHFNPYGAFELAKCVVSEVKKLGLDRIAEHIVNFDGYDPCYPAPKSDFHWVDSPYINTYAPQALEKDDAATVVPVK